MKFTIEAVCISGKKGVQKYEVSEITLIKDFGIDNDAHAGKWHRQVSFLAGEEIDKMKAKGLSLKSGAFGENIVTRGIDWTKVSVGGKIRIGDAELEVTQIGKECKTPCAIYYAAGECIMPEKGIFAKVLKGGVIHAHNSGDYHI
ncbi:MAG: MOSC domain-containing protein [Spirochaetales bacterium]|nr:MOSC domain-containing protein [Spirochaetales bacterium]